MAVDGVRPVAIATMGFGLLACPTPTAAAAKNGNRPRSHDNLLAGHLGTCDFSTADEAPRACDTVSTEDVTALEHLNRVSPRVETDLALEERRGVYRCARILAHVDGPKLLFLRSPRVFSQ